MQGLAALRLLLATGISQDSPEALRRAAGEAVELLDGEIGELRVLIAEMRGGDQTSTSPRSSA